MNIYMPWRHRWRCWEEGRAGRAKRKSPSAWSWRFVSKRRLVHQPLRDNLQQIFKFCQRKIIYLVLKSPSTASVEIWIGNPGDYVQYYPQEWKTMVRPNLYLGEECTDMLQNPQVKRSRIWGMTYWNACGEASLEEIPKQWLVKSIWVQ